MYKNDPHLLTAEQAASILNVKVHTLCCWRSTQRIALPYVKVGRCVRYRSEDIRAFVEGNLKGGSSDDS